jgi:hypothetical protein
MMPALLGLIATLSPSIAAGCEQTTIGALAKQPAPAIFVLGERRGTQPDLARAHRLVNRLTNTGEPVTLALQSVPRGKQAVLDRYAQGVLPSTDLPGLLDWSAANGFPYRPYEPLVTAAIQETEVLAVGVAAESRPADTPVPLAPGYIAVLQDAMSGHLMPPELEGRFVQTVSWVDHRVAKQAIENWDEQGYLVIVADRLHVEGSKGISWQASRMSGAEVVTVNLSGPGACYPGDVYL